MHRDLLVKHGNEGLFRVTDNGEPYFELQNMIDFMHISMGVSENFMKGFVKLFDSKRFCQNFLDVNYLHKVIPEDTYPISGKLALAEIQGLHICRDEDLKICICSPNNEFKMTLVFAERIMEYWYGYDGRFRIGLNSTMKSSNLFPATKNG